jgi:uncharacterized protein YciI
MTQHQFIYVSHPADPNTPMPDDALFERHWEYLTRAAGIGTLVLAGRAQDGEGPAITIIECESDDEARRFMEDDPFVSSGFASARLHPFRVAISRREV